MSVTQYIGARYVPLFADPAEWNNTRAYEPLTIVLYQGNSYTSRQAVPIGIEISNTDFWVLTGNYNAQVEAYRQEVLQYDSRITENTTNIEINAASIISEAETRYEEDEKLLAAIARITPKITPVDNRRYIDGDIGEDVAGGGSEDAPYKTLQFAFEDMLTQGYTDLRFSLLKSGTYTLNGKTIVSMGLHLQAEVTGCKVIFYNDNETSTDAFGVYNSHFNFSGIDENNPLEITCGNGAEMYMDGGQYTFTDCIFSNFLVRGHGADFRLNRCQFRLLHSNGGNIRTFGWIRITNTNPADHAMLLVNCNVFADYEIYGANLTSTSNSTRFFRMRGGQAKLLHQIPYTTLATKYYYNIENSGGILLMPTNGLNASAESSGSGSNYLHNTALTITNDVTLP